MINKISKQIISLILIISLIPLSFASGGGKGSTTFIQNQVFVTNTNKIIARSTIAKISSIYDPLGNEIYKNNDFYNKKILTMTNCYPNSNIQNSNIQNSNIQNSNPIKLLLLHSEQNSLTPLKPKLVLNDYNLNIIKQFNYITGNLQARNLKYNCQIGGQYTINGYYNTNTFHYESCGKHCTLKYRAVTKIPTKLFYCRTTTDLFNQVKIPSSWSNDKIIIYCNNGINTNFKTFNIDFLTTKLDTYDSCIIKNLNLPQNNTIIYSFENGNEHIDKTAKNTPLIQQIFANENVNTSLNKITKITTITNTKTNKIFKSTQINQTSLFILSDINDFSNPIPISNIISSKNFKLTRPILVKFFENKKSLSGYENTLRTEFPGLTNNKECNFAMYKIKFLGFGNIQNMCLENLGKYRATTSLVESSPVVCSYNTIQINDYQIFNKFNNLKGFNIFKNIILDTND